MLIRLGRLRHQAVAVILLADFPTCDILPES